MDELDPRLLQVVIEIGAVRYAFDQRLTIRAQGVLFANEILDTAEITIVNVDRATQDYLLNATSPYTPNKDAKFLTVFAGRRSYGMTLIYRGFILVSSVSQPPDIAITFICLSGPNFSNTVYSKNFPGLIRSEEVIQNLSNQMNAKLVNQATNLPMMSNYSITGTSQQEMVYLNQFGNFTIFLKKGDTDLLFVRNIFTYLTGTLRVLSESNGMIGIPEWTELGVKVTFLIDAKTTVGGYIDIDSKRYPAFSGRYGIYKLGFNLASRETPFYYIAEAARVIQQGEGFIPA